MAILQLYWSVLDMLVSMVGFTQHAKHDYLGYLLAVCFQSKLSDTDWVIYLAFLMVPLPNIFRPKIEAYNAHPHDHTQNVLLHLYTTQS